MNCPSNSLKTGNAISNLLGKKILDQMKHAWKGAVQMWHVAPVVSTAKVFGRKSKVRPFLESAKQARLARQFDFLIRWRFSQL